MAEPAGSADPSAGSAEAAEPAADVGAVTGRVLDQDGRPVAGVSVAVASSPGPHPDLAALTTSDGEFRLSRLPVGTVVLAARQSGRSGSAAADVVAGGTSEIEIEIS